MLGADNHTMDSYGASNHYGACRTSVGLVLLLAMSSVSSVRVCLRCTITGPYYAISCILALHKNTL